MHFTDRFLYLINIARRRRWDGGSQFVFRGGDPENNRFVVQFTQFALVLTLENPSSFQQLLEGRDIAGKSVVHTTILVRTDLCPRLLT